MPYRFKTEGQAILTKDLSFTILCLCLLANVGPDAFVSGRRRVRVWDERRPRLGYETDESGTAFADKLGCRICDLCFLGGQVGCSKSKKIKIGREATAPLKGRAFKIEMSKVSGSTLVAEICTDPHNRLLWRQHCSSLCSQSEGHEHVANMTNALGHDFVGFSVLVRHNIRPPHFASKVSYSASPQASAKCSRDAPCSDAALACYLLKNEPKFSWILNTLPRALPWGLWTCWAFSPRRAADKAFSA